MDRNGDGRVTLQDLEDLCNKYLTSRWYIHNSLTLKTICLKMFNF
jgi:hypothetical protein